MKSFLAQFLCLIPMVAAADMGDFAVPTDSMELSLEFNPNQSPRVHAYNGVNDIQKVNYYMRGNHVLTLTNAAGKKVRFVLPNEFEISGYDKQTPTEIFEGQQEKIRARYLSHRSLMVNVKALVSPSDEKLNKNVIENQVPLLKQDLFGDEDPLLLVGTIELTLLSKPGKSEEENAVTFSLPVKIAYNAQNIDYLDFTKKLAERKQVIENLLRGAQD